MSTETESLAIRRGTWHTIGLAAGVWLGVAIASTLVGLLERWPAQFLGTGRPDRVGTELLGEGTVLSPPLLMMVAMVVAVLLVAAASRRWLVRTGLALALLVGIVSVVGAFGEVVSAATPDVPRAAQTCGLIGVALSVWVVVAAAYEWVRG